MSALRGIPEQRTMARFNGDDRFAGAYAAYWPRTVPFISHQVRPSDRHTVEDLAQTTFERAWRFMDTARADDGHSLWVVVGDRPETWSTPLGAWDPPIDKKLSMSRPCATLAGDPLRS